MIWHYLKVECLSLSLWGFPSDSAGKESACSAGDLGSIPRLGRSLREGKGYPLQYSENSKDCMSMGSQRVGHDWATFTFSFGFSNSHVWMWEFDHKEGCAPENWCFGTVVLENTLESLLDCKEIQLVNPDRYQHWILIGKTDAEAEVPILWAPDARSQLIGKDSDAMKDCRQEKGQTRGDGENREWDG